MNQTTTTGADGSYLFANLLPGTYVVHSEVSGPHRMHVYDHLQNAASFDVTAGSTKETEGLVTLHPRWTIAGEGVTGRVDPSAD